MLQSPSSGISTLSPQRFDQTKHRPPFLLDWRAADFALSSNSSDILRVLARTGQEFSFTRDDTKPVRTSSGHLVTLSKDFPPWARVTANDGSTYTVLPTEGGRTNEFTRAKELDHADWTQTNLDSVGANQATGPDGTASLEELVEDSATSNHELRQQPSLTADANYALSCWAIANTRNWLRLQLTEVGGAVNFARAWFNLSTGAVGTANASGTGSLVRAYIRDYTDVAAGLYRCVLVGSVGNSATSIRGAIAIADADGSGSHSGDGSSSLYAGWAQLEDSANFASTFVPSVASALARDDELFQATDVGFSPQDIVAAGGLTVLTEWVEMGTAASGAASRYWHIGGSGPATDPRMFLYSPASVDGRIDCVFDDGSVPAFQSTAGGTASLFDHVRARYVVFLDSGSWKIQLHTSVNGAAEVSTSTATIGSTLPAAWSANTLTIGAAPNDTLHGFSGMARVAAAPGVRTLDYMTV